MMSNKNNFTCILKILSPVEVGARNPIGQRLEQDWEKSIFKCFRGENLAVAQE